MRVTARGDINHKYARVVRSGVWITEMGREGRGVGRQEWYYMGVGVGGTEVEQAKCLELP